MGKIYKEIDLREENPANKNIENILSVGSLVEGVEGIKFRDLEISRVYNIMSKSDSRAVLLVGDYGAGKRSVIEGYVNKIEKNMISDKVIEIDFNDILMKAHNSDFSQIISDVFNGAVENDDFEITLVLNNLGHLLNLNCYGNAGFSFVNTLVKAIDDDNLKIIATATTDEYKAIDDTFKRVLDYFTVIKLTELTKDETEEILNDDIDFYKSYYDMTFPDNICSIICNNADKYIKDKVFPGKAWKMLDEVCSSISNKYRLADKRLVKLNDEAEKLRDDLEKAIEENDYGKCDKINKELNSNYERFQKISEDVCHIDVTEEDIFEAIGDIVGVQMTRLDEDRTKFLREMPDEIKKYVIGQDDAVDTIVKNIRRNQLGLRKTSHSAGNFMFIGSTGVGKTYLAKQLAKYLYGSEDALLRLDMSEFQAEIDVSKLLGSAPGYVGYKESGLLVKGLAKKGETVVLFDEIEKAHPKIYDVLLQLLDEGFVTGSDGKKVDATKALIIFTSNIGVKEAQKMANPLGFSNHMDEKRNEKKEEIIRKALKNRFSPEFLNRLDNICYFNPLSKETLTSILQKELDESNNNIKAITGKTVKLSPEVKDWILDKVEKEDNGARPIIRILQQYIEENISDMVINEDPILNLKKRTLTAKLDNDKIVLK